MTQIKKGSVLVVGGGIAGMQAALDCANAGFKVYLLEKEPVIGGNMVKLDKTFPTNDCAMCMISPKLVETGRHLNIEIIAYADLKKIDGEAGNFTITINKRTRYVNEEKCNGCGECETVCPVTITDTFNGELSKRKAIYRPYPQAIPNVFTIDKAAAAPPCRATCPAGVNAQGYTALIAQKKFLNALDVVRERMPFAGICGRICHHPCESECNRKLIDEAVAVKHLKRFVADYEWKKIKAGESLEREPDELTQKERNNYVEKIAVIGAGPAGLTCANDLAKLGYSVTVFDKEEKAGGMLRYGIPDYRVPRDFTDYEIDLLLKQEGIEFAGGQTLGIDFTLDQLKDLGFDSTFIATGAWSSKKLKVPGIEDESIRSGIGFLHEVNSGFQMDVGESVLVIGGGNVAIDTARSAIRLPGVKSVEIYCLENSSEMPAHDWEIEAAKNEGVVFHNGWGPTEFTPVDTEKGKKTRAAFKQCVSVFDEAKRFRPQFNENITDEVSVNTVILAVGQQSDLSIVGKIVETENGRVKVNPVTLATSRDGIFAGGDNVLGPASLVEAVAQGHTAAESIHRFLRQPQEVEATNDETRGDGVVEAPQKAEIPIFADRTVKPRQEMPVSSIEDTSRGFSMTLTMETGYTEEMAVAEAQRCLQCGICSQCRECVRVCKAGAIEHEGVDREVTLNVGAVILSAGYDHFDATRKSEYGFGRFPNVVTAMQFERILSASGPYEGHLRRLSDGEVPEKIAWIQCVGSRDVTTGNPYCSTVCCMYATKEAIVAKEHEACVRPTIFYIDMRTFGKGYEGFQRRAREDYGVRYVRSQVSSIKENPFNRNLILTYVDPDGGVEIKEEEFDMVVLSTAIVAGAWMEELAAVTGLTRDEFGFIPGDPLRLPRSLREGIFLSGALSGPKDIPDTVMQSSAAAALCGQLLHEVRNTEVQIKEYPVETDVNGMEPRIGVFICHCGINIASVVDVAEVTEYMKTIPGVAYATRFIYTCSQDSQEEIKRVIRKHNLNRVIVASCTPRTHESLFQETIKEAGLNKYLFEMANIREQCSWVHRAEPDIATGKAKTLVRGSVGKSAHLEPLVLQTVPVVKAALVVGGGISGLTAALSLAKQGFEVFLVEKAPQLGGQLLHVYRSLEGNDWREHLTQTIAEVKRHPRIQIYLNAQLESVSGFIGNFTSTVNLNHPLTPESQTPPPNSQPPPLLGDPRGAPPWPSESPPEGPPEAEKPPEASELKHGVIVLATGAGEFEPEGFLYREDERVITQRQLEARLEEGVSGSFDGSGGDIPYTIVMIQCVGSRDSDRQYCSRVCCGAAVKNALSVKKRNPNARVIILYRDMNTYQFRELYYREAREKGVMFIHFPDDRYPVVNAGDATGEGKLDVGVFDTVLGEELSWAADLVVLSTAIVPDRLENGALSESLKLSLDEHGFFMEAHVKLRPVDFANEGHFVCGLAHSPKYTEENITQALAAAGRAATVLSRDSLQVGGVVSVVDADKCAVCLTCVRECVFSAPFINGDGKAEIEAAKCQGCGNCAAACPAKAIQLKTFTDDQQRALFKHILTGGEELGKDFSHR